MAAALAALRESGIAGEVVVADNASEDRSAELAAAAGARVVHEPRRGYGSAYLAGFAAARGRYIVMGDADLTYDFREIPRFVEQLDDGRRAGHGRPDGQHPPGRDAVAAPLRRQPGADRHPQRLLPHRRERRALRHAGAAARRAAAARPAHDGHGVRLGDGHPGLEGAARHPRVPDRVPPARRREQAVELPRRLAPPALPARPQPDAPLHAARRAHARRSARSSRSSSLAADRRVRPRVGPPHDGRRRAADDRRHPGGRPRPLRARLRHVLHGRAGPVVRPHARSRFRLEHGLLLGGAVLVARARDRRGHRRRLDRPRLRPAVRGAPGGPRGDAA